MSSSVFNMSMPDTLRRHAEGRTRVGGYGSVAEYIRDLIRMDQRQNPVKNDPGADSPRRVSQLASAARPTFGADAFRRRDRY
ncbi:MAG: type II toxin-antitoxin system ParD family antitoxin [Pyrinomonadaceae bacterium]